MQTNFNTRYHVMEISSVEAFMNVKGGCSKGCKDVYFLRITGVGRTMPEEIRQMDQILTERMNRGQGFYSRLNGLPRLAAMEDAEFYGGCYESWLSSGKQDAPIKAAMENQQLRRILGGICAEILSLLEQGKQGVSSSIGKNFMVKVLFWLDQTVPLALRNWKPENTMKVVCRDISKQQEYLFFYLLTRLGFDVLLLQARQDISPELDRLGLSRKCTAAEPGQYEVPEYEPVSDGEIRTGHTVQRKTQAGEMRIAVNTRVPERDRRTREMLSARENRVNSGRMGRELTYEELAQLASSVVQIMIHDSRGEVIGGGSGIMIGREGYILTNNHVACRGRFYSVRIEEDDQVYQTDEMIKYNSVLDLAVLRIERNLQPLPIYNRQKKLVRGQRVVAIGSPLGLFNSVSDGIISGFRAIEGVDMIQFTAPISNGSSGGAVLNMYGEVIGISTAGFDAGQNINLAVGYEYIRNFVQGFVS
ncbi:MAG: trypsin-like serine protease [Lachnospiraceae bacterium]|nr:trypsin-like serine protease [Lachnospiraceae bacterium]